MKKILFVLCGLMFVVCANADKKYSTGSVYIKTDTSGDLTTIYVGANNPEALSAGYQIEFRLSSGVTINTVTTTNEDEEEVTSYDFSKLTSSKGGITKGTFNTNSLTAKSDADHYLYLLSAGLGTGTMTAQDGYFMYFKVKGVTATSTISLFDCNYSDPDGVSYYFNDVQYNISTGTSTTGINEVKTSEASDFYNVSGQSVKAPQKGLNIVKTANGVKKVMVK